LATCEISEPVSKKNPAAEEVAVGSESPRSAPVGEKSELQEVCFLKKQVEKKGYQRCQTTKNLRYFK